MNWKIEINNPSLGGLAPGFYKETYPSYGNKNQAGAMQNMDLTNPGYITQGPGLSNLTNGTQAAELSTLIKGIIDTPFLESTSFGVGGNKLYYLDYNSGSEQVVDDANYAHTIDKAAVTGESGEDVAYYGGQVIYYTYNHSGGDGDIGKCTLFNTFDDDWGSTVPTGAGVLESAPHQICIGGNSIMYIANDRYVASYDGTTLTLQALDLPTGSIISSLKWKSDRLWIAANQQTSSSQEVKVRGSIYVWDGTTDTWEAEILTDGKVGALFVKNDILYAFTYDQNSTGGYKLTYVNGSSVVPLANFTGSLPKYYQVTSWKDFILWVSDASIWAYGAGDNELPARLFQFSDGGYATVGGLAAPFGTPFIASTDGGSNFRLAKFSGYDTACNWKSLIFDITGNSKSPGGVIKGVRINFETLASGAVVDWSLKDNQGRTIFSDTISYAKATATTPLHSLTSAYYPLNGKAAENLRVEFDYTNGSATNPVKIKNIKIYGTTD